MALYNTIKSIVDDNIFDNVDELITGAIHNDVLHELIDAVGAAQVYVNPAVTDNPGTIENPRAYIALPGVYTNFGGLEITAPLGVLLWNGTAWSVTQLAIPSPYNYFRAKTTSALTAGTPYTTVNISQSLGGYTAKAGHWVQLINRRTGKFDHVQLTADLDPSDTAITFDARTLVQSFPIGSAVELFPRLNMKWWCEIPVVGAPVDYVDLPADYRLPPAETVDPLVWMEYVRVTKGPFECEFNATPSEEWQYKRHATLQRIHFSGVLSVGDRVRVWVYQPAVLEVAS